MAKTTVQQIKIFSLTTLLVNGEKEANDFAKTILKETGNYPELNATSKNISVTYKELIDLDDVKTNKELIIDKLNEAFLPKNIECDGSFCQGCWKDIIREVIKMIKENKD